MNILKKLLLTSSCLLFLLLSCSNPEQQAITIAKKWCSCNEGIVSLYEQLQAASTPNERMLFLDSMQLKVADNMNCLGGEAALESLDNNMNDEQKEAFINTLKTVQEESCPEVFKVFNDMEAQLNR